jgi:hypothetical protein
MPPRRINHLRTLLQRQIGLNSFVSNNLHLIPVSRRAENGTRNQSLTNTFVSEFSRNLNPSNQLRTLVAKTAGGANQRPKFLQNSIPAKGGSANFRRNPTRHQPRNTRVCSSTLDARRSTLDFQLSTLNDEPPSLISSCFTDSLEWRA